MLASVTVTLGEKLCVHLTRTAGHRQIRRSLAGVAIYYWEVFSYITRDYVPRCDRRSFYKMMSLVTGVICAEPMASLLRALVFTAAL